MGALGGGGGLMKAWFDCLIGANLNIVACLTAKENKLQDFYGFKMIRKINWHCWQIMCTRWRLLLPPGAWHFLTLMCWVMWPGMVVFIPIYYSELLEGLEVVHYGSCRVFVSYSKHLLFLSTAVSSGSGNMRIRGRQFFLQSILVEFESQNGSMLHTMNPCPNLILCHET